MLMGPIYVWTGADRRGLTRSAKTYLRETDRQKNGRREDRQIYTETHAHYAE